MVRFTTQSAATEAGGYSVISGFFESVISGFESVISGFESVISGFESVISGFFFPRFPYTNPANFSIQ